MNLALHGNKVMSVTPEAVNLYLKIQRNNISFFIGICLAVWVCVKQGPENMVLLQIGAEDLTVENASSAEE